MRDALLGMTRFDQFQRSLDISPNILTRRLNALVEADLLERRRYSERPPRDEYIPTEKGKDFWPVLCSLLAWGNKHLRRRVRALSLWIGERADNHTPLSSTAKVANY